MFKTYMSIDVILLTKFEEGASPGFSFEDNNKGYTLRYAFISKESMSLLNM